MWHLSSESSPCTLRSGKTLPADNRIVKIQAGCEENSLLKQGASWPACRPAVCGRETAFPDRDWIESVLKRGNRGRFSNAPRPVRANRDLLRVIVNSSGGLPILCGSFLAAGGRDQALPRRLPAANHQHAAPFRQSKAMRAHRGRRRRSGGFIAGTRSPLAVRGSPLRAIRSVESVSEI